MSISSTPYSLQLLKCSHAVPSHDGYWQYPDELLELLESTDDDELLEYNSLLEELLESTDDELLETLYISLLELSEYPPLVEELESRDDELNEELESRDELELELLEE